MEWHCDVSEDVGRPSVVIAEDNRLNQELLHDYLTAWGFAVTTAWDGFEALELSIAQRPELIIMDIQMPRIDGVTAIGRIRATPGLADVPIIALTALAMAGDRERCLAAGANVYLAKPVRLQVLRTVAGELLARQLARAHGA